MLYIRAFLFYFGQAISIILYTPLGLVVFPLSFKIKYFLVTRWTLFNLWWLKICCGISYKIKGLENISKTPGIVMCKHQSAFETLALQLIFVPQVWILKRELLKIPIYGWGLSAMQPIAIDRGSAIKSLNQIVTQGCQSLEQNKWIIIFPEGTRVLPGKKGKYNRGGSLLAIEAKADITPVAHNAGYLWARNSFIKFKGEITIIIGAPISSKGKTTSELNKEVENWIEDTVKSLPLPHEK